MGASLGMRDVFDVLKVSIKLALSDFDAKKAVNVSPNILYEFF